MKRAPRNRGRYRRPGLADPAPLVTADEVRRAAKVLAAARNARPDKAEQSARIWAHIAALRADCERLSAKANASAGAVTITTDEAPVHHSV